MQLTLLGGAIAIIVLWLFFRRRSQTRQSPEPAKFKPAGSGDSTYHAVSIKFDTNACAAAQEMSGRRFLSSAAPRLPLPECNALECRCRFVHHDDRRAGKDRRSPFAASGYAGGTGSYQQERRENRDRRKDDNDLDDF